jgi:hypothetical protein
MKHIVILAALLLAMPHGAGAAPKKGPGCLLPNADTVLHGIALGDDDSTRRVLGKTYKATPDDPNTDFPWYAFASRDGAQTMRLRSHAGGVVDSYLEFEVRRGRDPKATLLAAGGFVSGKGVKLGMARGQIVALFGPCFTTRRNGRTEIVRYEIEQDFEKQTSPALKAANMPQYYAEYDFENGKLVRFAFGHDPV